MPLTSEDVSSDSVATTSLFGAVGLGMLGLAFAVTAARDGVMASARAVFKDDKITATLACAVGVAVAVRVGTSFA
jgi:hypothetical protein